MCRAYWTLGFAITACAITACRSSPSFAADTDEAASLLRAFCANVAAVRSFDVLLQHEEINDVINDSLSRETAFIRIRADRDKNAYICATYRRNVEQSFGNGDANGPTRKIRLCGFQWIANEGSFREIPEPLYPIGSSIDGVVRDQNIPDLRCIGLDFFPSRFPGRGEIGVFQNWENTRLVSPLLTAKNNSSDSTTINFQNSFSSHPQLEMKQSWEFDLRRFVPIRLDRQIIDNHSNVPKVIPQQFQVFDWEERMGVFVPVKIVGSRISQKGNSTNYEVETTTFLHWLSTNESFEDGAFARDLIATEKALIELTDPLRNGIEKKFDH